jgi:predicted transcriptional regulator
MVVKVVHSEYRSRDEIYRDILATVKSYEPHGALKIKLLYGSRLSDVQLTMYVRSLLANGLLTIDSSKGRPVATSSKGLAKAKMTRRGDRYKITEKGLKYLQMIEEMKRSMSGIHI